MELSCATICSKGLAKWVNDGEEMLSQLLDRLSLEKPRTNGTVTYTVKLRDGIKWSDGQAVTSGDFVYAWQRLAILRQQQITAT